MLEKKNNNTKLLNIQRIYIQDISFESPNTPEIFHMHWDPKINVKLNNNYIKIHENLYEVILCITVTATLEKKIAFLCQVKQAGIFNILVNLSPIQMEHCLNSYCPNILFPYIRECINSQITRGTFPSFHLNPINFNFLFTEFLQNKSKDTSQ